VIALAISILIQFNINAIKNEKITKKKATEDNHRIEKAFA